MKIVVLNGSPRKGGNTEIMTQAFAEAARKNQNEVSILDVAPMNIRGCLGCKYCWAHKGECVQKDDMGKVFEALVDADMVVFASPIYWFDITAQMKTVIDRLCACGAVVCLCFALGLYESFAPVWLTLLCAALLLDAGADHVFDAAIAQYKEKQNTDLILSEGEAVRTKVRDNIELDLLCRNQPESAPVMQEIYELVVETIQLRSPVLRLGSNLFPMALVRERLLQLTSEHIRFVLDGLRNLHTDVKNLKKYLLTMLFNAPVTLNGRTMLDVRKSVNSAFRPMLA